MLFWWIYTGMQTILPTNPLIPYQLYLYSVFSVFQIFSRSDNSQYYHKNIILY